MSILKYLAASFVAMATAAASFAAAPQAVYLCGEFNGWDPKNPSVLLPGEDGIYSGVIDFARGKSFKMSTVRGETGNGWSEFDTGTLNMTQDPEVGKWTPIEFKVKSENQTSPAALAINVSVDLDKMLILFGNAGETIHDWSGTLPVLFINTEGGAPITSKETYINATWYLDPMKTSCKALGSKDAPLTMEIRGRGNYTWSGFNKKPYRLKLTDKQPMLGMPKSKHWALLANADDNQGFLRNFTGFTASELLGMPWTPGSQPCEVVLNGDYIGLYFLTETIRVAKDRVNVEEQADNATTDVDGGWLVEIDNYDSDPHVTVTENGKYPIWFTYKSPEVLSSEQGSYLLQQMTAINNAIYADGGNEQAFADLVDLDVLARYYIVQELLDDTESFHGSCYLNRQRGAAEKWKFGPVWDFGNAFSRDNSQKFIYQDPTFHQVWIGGMAKFPAFQSRVKEVWGWFLGFGPDELDARIDKFATEIATAAAYDARRWPDYGNANEMQRASQVRSWLERRIAWLKTQWGSEAGVEDIAVSGEPSVSVRALSGTLLLTARKDCTVAVYAIDGRAVRTLRLAAGEETGVNLPRGMYIVDGQKVIL